MSVRSRRKLALVALGSFLGLVALELVLQIISYVIWVSDPAPPPLRSKDGMVVLCVGDSFTQGLGASDPANAYPRRLEAYLGRQAGGPAWRVFNCGRAGSSSKELLAKLPQQLADYRPDLVCVLTGYNDFWSTREPEDGFPLELRTLRLLSMIVHWFGSGSGDTAPEPRAPGSAPFLGDWHAGDVWIRFTPDGRIESNRGELEFYWSWLPERIVLRSRQRDETDFATWRIDGERLVLAGSFVAGELRFERGPLLRNDLDRAAHALRGGDAAAARELFEACLEDPALEVGARAGLVSLHAQRGDLDAARAQIARLEALSAKAPSPALDRALIRAYLEVDDVERAFAEVARLLVAGDIDAPLLQLIVGRALELADRTALVAAVEEALAREGLADDIRVALLGARAALGPDDADVAMSCLIRAYLVRGDEALLQKTVLRDRSRFSRERFDSVLPALELDAGEVRRARAAFERALAAEDRTTDVLARNLRRVVRLCREAGAEPVLLTYPIHQSEVEGIVRDVAGTMSVGWIDVRATFAELLRTAEFSDYFVLDGHCNDRGYAVLAELVGTFALTRVK